MVFSSSVFLFIFLPITLSIYYLLDSRFRNTFLLISSLFFYFWGEPKFIIIMFVSILLNYTFGILIHLTQANRENDTLERMVLIVAIMGNLGLLFYFKYFDFAIGLINQSLNTDIALKNISLPIGISFFTFQGMTYVFDVYWGKTPVQKNLLKVALYISLFPQLIAGPIVRYHDVNLQIDNRSVSIGKFYEGIKRFVVGLSKKVIIANSLALIADGIFNLPYSEITLSTAWLGIICYSLQIYFDFSGYSDMAIGLGKMFGFDFLENFNYPYISKSITEFWRRGHISLSTFFRDYLYIPLGGNRKGNVYLNLFIVFFMTGLWHGASVNFVVWGLWHGVFIFIEKISKKSFFANINIHSVFKRIYTLLVVMIGWVVFRADNMSQAIGYIGVMFGITSPQSIWFTTMYYLDNFSISIMLVAIIMSTGVLPWLLIKIEKKLDHRAGLALDIAKVANVSLLMLICIIFVMSSTYNPFIYFRF